MSKHSWWLTMMQYDITQPYQEESSHLQPSPTKQCSVNKGFPLLHAKGSRHALMAPCRVPWQLYSTCLHVLKMLALYLQCIIIPTLIVCLSQSSSWIWYQYYRAHRGQVCYYTMYSPRINQCMPIEHVYDNGNPDIPLMQWESDNKYLVSLEKVIKSFLQW